MQGWPRTAAIRPDHCVAGGVVGATLSSSKGKDGATLGSVAWRGQAVCACKMFGAATSGAEGGGGGEGALSRSVPSHAGGARVDGPPEDSQGPPIESSSSPPSYLPPGLPLPLPAPSLKRAVVSATSLRHFDGFQPTAKTCAEDSRVRCSAGTTPVPRWCMH